MVCLHTGTMGVHPACFFIVRAEDVATQDGNRPRNTPSYSVYSSCCRAPTGDRQEFLIDERVDLFHVKLAVAVLVHHVEERHERTMIFQLFLFEIFVVVRVGGLKLAGVVASCVLGSVLAAVGVEFQADLADRDLDVAVGEFLNADLGRQGFGVPTRRLDRRGSVPTWNASSVRFAASASTT